MSLSAADVPLGAGAFAESRLHKELRHTSRGLASRLLSIEHDAQRALRVYTKLSHLPLFGNARAGAWYVPPEMSPRPATASFKSADGHYGRWASSLRRPNAHVLAAAVEKGGVVVVDVTRAGKRWPDSLTKTVPIWCAVVNAVVGLGGACVCGVEGEEAGFAEAGKLIEEEREGCSKCVSLHLHPSVSGSEREQIKAQLPNWVRAWRNAGTELHRLVPSFASARERAMKPLRPLWVAPERPIWEDGVPLEQLDFTPVICVSASAVVPTGQRAFVEARVDEEVICGITFPKRAVGFSYVQGAGDDEEAWCQGLSPWLFWSHREQLLSVATGDDDSTGAIDVESKLSAMIENIVSQSHPSAPTSDISGLGGIGIPIWKSRLRLAHFPVSERPKFTSAVGNLYDTVIILGASSPVTELQPPEGQRHCHAVEQGITWVPLTGKNGKLEHKYAFGRALGPCLSRLRDCCVDRKKEALICCSGKSGDWSAGLAIAWIAWHCIPALAQTSPTSVEPSSDEDSLIDRVEKMAYVVDVNRKAVVGKVGKDRVHATMLQFSSTYPQFQISRVTLKQLNRFFSSPAPSSVVTELTKEPRQ